MFSSSMVKVDGILKHWKIMLNEILAIQAIQLQTIAERIEFYFHILIIRIGLDVNNVFVYIERCVKEIDDIGSIELG